MENSSLSVVALEHEASADPTVEENGEQEAEPLKNGPEHSSEAESSDGVLTPALEEPNSDTIQSTTPPLLTSALIIFFSPRNVYLWLTSSLRPGAKEWKKAIQQKLSTELPVHGCLCAEARGASAHI